MKKCVVVVLLLTLGFYLSVSSNVAFAQEAEETTPALEPAAEEMEETEFSYGTVKSVSGDQLVLSEYDYEQDKEIDVTYTVPADATLEGVQSLQEIAVGDTVDIDFLVQDGKKVATLVTVEKAGEGEEEDLELEETEEAKTE